MFKIKSQESIPQVQIPHPTQAMFKLPTPGAWMTIKCPWITKGGGGDEGAGEGYRDCRIRFNLHMNGGQQLKL